MSGLSLKAVDWFLFVLMILAVLYAGHEIATAIYNVVP